MDSLILLNNKNDVSSPTPDKENPFKKIYESQNNDSGCENSAINSSESVNGAESNNKTSTSDATKEPKVKSSPTVGSSGSTDLDEIVILRKDPKTQRNLINKSAYAKLHRSYSSDRHSNSIDSIKKRYESGPQIGVGDGEPKTRPGQIERIALKRNPAVKLDEETVVSLKNKYSPASFGYPRPVSRNSKLPVPKPRSSVKSQIITSPNKHPDKNKLRYSLDIDKKSKRKDENSNELFRKSSSSSGELITIITRSESEASIDKFEKELSLFTMERKPKDKKRSNSFRKIFSGKIFSKDKKKKEEEKNKVQFRENAAYSENIHNETHALNRQSTYRHTLGGNSNSMPVDRKQTRSERDSVPQQQNHNTKEIEERYAQMHVNQFNHIKQNFETQNPQPTSLDYVCMDFKQQQTATNNPGPLSYINMPNVPNKYIDTSSSTSTVESERLKLYPNEELANAYKLNETREEDNSTLETAGNIKGARYVDSTRDTSRDTPPRAQELWQDVRLVNPKALIPINSERPLPNPYQNSGYSSLDRPPISPKPNSLSFNSVESNSEKTKIQKQPQFEETYGTVFDSIEGSRGRIRTTPRISPTTNDFKEKPPRSPSFEPSKLKLPPNREIVPLSPRVKSPIPPNNVSTEKIIATELLKSTRSPTLTRKSNKLTSPTHKKLELDIDYPDNVNIERTSESNIPLASKPPISKLIPRRSPEVTSSSSSLAKPRLSAQSPGLENKRLSQSSPAFDNRENLVIRHRQSQVSPALENQEIITTNALVHANSTINRALTPNSLLLNRSLSPLRSSSARSSTPVDPRQSPSIKSQSPQKEDMRKSVEAYYWKEIKKLKEQENYDMYLYQMQMYGYVEDPVTSRRSRSLSPASSRNSRRSLSLPRDPRLTTIVKEMADPYGRLQQPDSIPEGRAVVHQQLPQRNVVYGELLENQNFRRNTPQRRTIDGTTRSYDNYNNNSLYRPIFKRGSLTTPVKELTDDQQNKKVSFLSSNGDNIQNAQAWPTRNGFTQSPPQRRIDSNRNSSLDDDVFLPNTPRTPYTPNGNEVYGYINKPNYNYGPGIAESYVYRQNNPTDNRMPLYEKTPKVYYSPTNQDQFYGRAYNANPKMREEECPYGQPADAVRSPYGLTRHGSIQMHQEPIYVQRQPPTPRRMSYENLPVNYARQNRPVPDHVNRQRMPPPVQHDPRFGLQKREIIMNDEIFGQFGGYIPQSNQEDVYLVTRQPQNPIYSSRQSVAEPLYGRSVPKQVSVRNKVCDMYGQIHDRDSPSVASANHVRNSGVILGQLQSNPGSPQVVRQSYSHLPNQSFVRNSRLTASANDMHKRYQNVDPRYRSDWMPGDARYSNQEGVAPTRPLPPVPMDKKVLLHNNSRKSDTESASDTGEMLRVQNKRSTKNKKRSFFGEPDSETF